MTRRRQRRERVRHNRIRRGLIRDGHGDALGSWTARLAMRAYVKDVEQRLEEGRRFDADLAARGLSRADFFVAHVINQD